MSDLFSERAASLSVAVWNRVCAALARLHGLLARGFGGAAVWAWRRQAAWPLPVRLCGAFASLALLSAGCAWFFPDGYAAWADWGPDKRRVLELSGVWAGGARLRVGAWGVTALCLAAALAGWRRRAGVLWLLKSAWAAWALLWFCAMRWALTAPAVLHRTDFRLFGKDARDALWAAAFGYGFFLLLLPAAALLWLALAETRRWFACGDPTGPLVGDRVIDSLRTGGADPRYRTSVYWAVGLALMTLLAPLLIRGCGREEAYGLVKGSGAAEIQMVTVKRAKPKKERKLIVNAWSPYIFERMRIDDATVKEVLQEQTADTYQASARKTGGRPGKGGGKTGGWPDGMEGAAVRFIRLQYTGGDWDQDMGKGADYNLLLRLHEETGFPIARDTESREIGRLRLFPKDKAPPFVFLTGKGAINVSDQEVETLRWYVETEGGLLLIDNGGGTFDRSVRSLLARVLPGQPLMDIANDDPVYQTPYLFPDGAPPLWHHAGNRALGVKVGGRWAVFYHPGDMNDAWKDGHSGVSEDVADLAYKLGINVICYAFNAYDRRHHAAETKRGP